MNEIYNCIKKLSNNNNLTLAELEKITNLSNGTINRWKNSIPRVDGLNKIAKYFNVSLDFLVNGEDKVSSVFNNISNSSIVQNNNATTLIVKNGETVTRELTEQEIELLKIYNSLDLRQQTIFLSKVFQLEDELK